MLATLSVSPISIVKAHGGCGYHKDSIRLLLSIKYEPMADDLIIYDHELSGLELAKYVRLRLTAGETIEDIARKFDNNKDMFSHSKIATRHHQHQGTPQV